MNARSFALVLVRWLALLLLVLGTQGVLGIVLAMAVRAWGWSIVPTALRDNFDYFYATELWGTPIYLLAGVILLLASKHLARAISRDVEA